MKRLIIGGIGGIAALVTPVVLASPVLADDDMYLNLLRGYGVSIPSNSQAIVAGHRVCQAIKQDSIAPSRAHQVITGWSIQQAKTLVGVAVTAYCPEVGAGEGWY